MFTVSHPPKTSALPRHLYGRHLILEHRHHVHQRAVQERMIRVHAKPPQVEQCNETEFSVTPEKLLHAKNTVNETQAGILELLEKYVSNQSELQQFGVQWETAN